MPTMRLMQDVRLYFGRDIAGRAPVSDAEWAEFAEHVLTPLFPDGFTTLKGSGQWLDSASNHVIREDSIVVEVAIGPGADFSRRVNRVVAAYRQQFHQEAVGVIATPVCAAF